MPVEPIPQKQHSAVRLFRWLAFIVLECGLAYLLWDSHHWWGVAFALVIGFLWGLEIKRGNQTEDYIFENYENPLR